MNLQSVMHLLGHHSIQSTLKYAAVTQTTILKEYHSAQQQIRSKINLPFQPFHSANESLEISLSDALRILKKAINQTEDAPQTQKQLQLVLKRLHAIHRSNRKQPST
jgi:hypothetical protein